MKFILNDEMFTLEDLLFLSKNIADLKLKYPSKTDSSIKEIQQEMKNIIESSRLDE
jgi:hypothetical protein